MRKIPGISGSVTIPMPNVKIQTPMNEQAQLIWNGKNARLPLIEGTASRLDSSDRVD
jgi:hypothetical protein